MEMDTPDFEHGRVYFKQFGAERVNKLLEMISLVSQSFNRGRKPHKNNALVIEECDAVL